MSENLVGTMFVIGSFGASAVLVYGAPLAEFSQPRNLIGGSVLSALIGVAVYQVCGDYVVLASALAVSLSIALMYLTRTLHPPGGATALIAVIGGENVHQLGFLYALMPVFLGSVLLLLVALVVNNLSTDPKRHYPVYWI
jgi:CBS-domain-containing membrane protein